MLYEFKCENCGYYFIHQQTLSESSPSICPQCRGRLYRTFTSTPTIVFKGTGFYSTDNK